MKRDAVLMIAVAERLGYLNGLMEEILYRELPPVPEVKFDLRGNASGVADMALRIIRFNYELLASNPDEFLQDCVGHEYAHIHVADQHGILPFQHGQEWQGTMCSLGVAPRITHTMQKPRKVHTYRCNCATMHDATEAEHKAIQKGAEFVCNVCKVQVWEQPKHVFKAGTGKYLKVANKGNEKPGVVWHK